MNEPARAEAPSPRLALKACHSCGRIHRVPKLSPRETAWCTRCDAILARFAHRRETGLRTAATSLGAFFLFWPAVFLPILKIERLGHTSESSLFFGTIDLFEHGNWFVGSVVLLFSIIFPLAKILLFLELSLLGVLHKRHRARTYRIMEHVGKWSMMDVMLLAFMVMLVKLGSLVEFQFGLAVISFVLCVVMSMLASIFFDPHAIWEESND